MPSVPPTGGGKPHSHPTEPDKTGADKTTAPHVKGGSGGTGAAAWDNFMAQCTPDQRKKINDGFIKVINQQIEKDRKKQHELYLKQKRLIETGSEDE